MKWGIMVMNSRTSFINRGILGNDLKRFAWVGIVYLLGLLLAIPLKVFMIYSHLQAAGITDTASYSQVLNYDSSALQLLLLLIVPVLTGLLLFRYLQVSSAADMEHALPIRRQTLYNTHVLAGLIFLVVPLIITALVTWALAAVWGIAPLDGGAILTWLGTSLLLNLLFFLTTVAIGMFTGMTSLQGVLTYILLLLPAGLSLLIPHNISKFLYGFPYDHYRSTGISDLSPLVRLESLSNRPLSAGEVAVYLLIVIAIYWLGRYLYQRRPLERAGSAVAFDILGQILKYGVVFCSMLLAGTLFSDAQDGIGWTYFGYLLGSLLAYILMEILLEKSWYIFQWQRFKGYGIYALVVIVFVGGLNLDITGYEKRMPPLGEVESVYLDNTFFLFEHRSNFPDEAYPPGSGPVPPIFIEPENLASIYALHEAIIKSPEGKRVQQFGKQRIFREPTCLVYELKDGRRFYRQYRINRAILGDKLKPIYESREYKELHNELLRINPATVNLIEVSTREGTKQLRITREDLMQQAVAALRQDILAQSYAEMTNPKASWAHISISLPDRNGIDLAWQKSYTNFANWLRATGQYEQARLLPEDISQALVSQAFQFNESAPDGRYEPKSRSIDMADLEKRPGVLHITDSRELEQCLQDYYDSYYEEAAYDVIFLLKNDRTVEGVFLEGQVPAFIAGR